MKKHTDMKPAITPITSPSNDLIDSCLGKSPKPSDSALDDAADKRMTLMFECNFSLRCVLPLSSSKASQIGSYDWLRSISGWIT